MSSQESPPTMTCMEVWGGNQATERAFSTLGLETWVYSQPYQKAEGGGDVYFASSCATGRITRLLVADVSGHGAAVADTASRLRQLMRRHMNQVKQAKFVSRMNAEFQGLVHSGGFATAVAATFYAPTKTLTITNAGHPSPLYFDSTAGTWDVWQDSDTSHTDGPADLPLGILEEMNYCERQAPLSGGDLILVYTDSLMESKRPDGQLLGIDGLLELVRQLDCSDPAAIIPELLKSIADLNPVNLTEDDVTAMLVRPTGGSGKVPFKKRWEAPFRFIWGCGKAALTGQPLPLPEFTLANLGGSMFDSLGKGRPGSR